MKLKKATAALGLASIVLMLVHMGYNVFAYLMFYYNPAVQMALSVPFMVMVCIHAICGMLSVSLKKEGGSLDLYTRHNIRTILQRVSAALIFPLLIMHINTFSLLEAAAQSAVPALVVLIFAAEILFFACVVTHVATSLTNALITLGILASRDTQHTLDRIIYVIGAIAFAVASYAVVSGQASMFLAG